MLLLWTFCAAAAQAQDAGHLRVVGAYPVHMKGQLSTRLPDGSVLAYGSDPLNFQRHGDHSRVANLRNRHSTQANGGAREAWLWEPKLRKWSKYEAAPECSGARFLHQVTPLPDQRLLMSGGLCDTNDAAPEYRAMSIWNGLSRQWDHAPPLNQGRVYHSATALPDGAVLMAGGLRDPAQTKSDEALDSVELLRDGSVVQLPSMLQARARHSAMLTKGGRVLVAGGQGKDGKAIAAAEYFDPKTNRWIVLPPMGTARYGHSASLLDDGSIVVAGGTGADGRPLRSTEILDSYGESWRAGFALPRALSEHSALRLANGDVLIAGGIDAVEPYAQDWAWLRDHATGEWALAGRARPEVEEDLAARLSLAANPDGSVHVFGQKHILQWRPGASGYTGPHWGNQPSMVGLADGSLMMIASTEAEPRWQAFTWNPKDDSWRAAGQLAYRAGMQRTALRLRSGRVMFLGLTQDNHLLCELGPAELWSACGDMPLSLKAPTVKADLLPDGRVVVLVNSEEAKIYDERSGQWSSAKLVWQESGFIAGAPVVPDHAFTTLVEDDGKGTDISPIGVEFYGSSNPGNPMPELLWDAAKKRYAYIFPINSMGRNTAFLADRCVIGAMLPFSDDSLALFQHASGKARRLANIGIGIPHHSAGLFVLADGRVVLAGQAVGADQGFFVRKAGCEGWAEASDDWARMPGELPRPELVGIVNPNAPTAAVAAAAAAPPAPPTPPLLERLMPYRYIALALLLPAIGYLLFRRVRVKMSSGFSWTLRIIVLLVAGFFALPFIGVIQWDRGQSQAGPLGASADCAYVGEWNQTGQDHVIRRLQLKDDGSFSLKDPNGRIYAGSWQVKGDQFTWRDKDAVRADADDVNQILETDGKRFVLREQNGWKTVFDRLEVPSSGRCAAPR